MATEVELSLWDLVAAVAEEPRATEPEKVFAPAIVCVDDKSAKAPVPPIEMTVLASPLTSVPVP